MDFYHFEFSAGMLRNCVYGNDFKFMLLKRIGIPHIFLLCFEARKG